MYRGLSQAFVGVLSSPLELEIGFSTGSRGGDSPNLP